MTPPPPGGWRQLGSGLTLVFISCCAIVIVAFLLAILCIVDGELPEAIFALLIGLCAAALSIGVARALFGYVTVRVEFGEGGSEIREDIVCTSCWIVALCVSFCLGVLLLLTAFGLVEIEAISDTRGSPFFVSLMIMSGVSWCFAWMLRAGLPRVVLSPSGISLYTMGGVRSIHWGDIIEINGRKKSGMRSSGSSVVVSGMGSRPIMIYSAKTYVPGGAALVSMLRYYRAHPELRCELTTSCAGNRLIDDDFSGGS